LLLSGSLDDWQEGQTPGHQAEATDLTGTKATWPCGRVSQPNRAHLARPKGGG